jgi:hypothetical protein
MAAIGLSRCGDMDPSIAAVGVGKRDMRPSPWPDTRTGQSAPGVIETPATTVSRTQAASACRLHTTPVHPGQPIRCRRMHGRQACDERIRAPMGM